MGGYKFLMENFRPGDKVCLFGELHAISLELDAYSNSGFSRGAYTARALAGMLHKVIRVVRNVIRDL